MKRGYVPRKIARILPFPVGVTAFWSLVLILLSLALMIFSVIWPGAFSGVRARMADMFLPAFTVISQPFQNVAMFFVNMKDITLLQAEYERLKEENTRLQEWYQMALLLESENKSLRELLNMKIDPRYDYVSARIVAGSGSTYVKSVLVSAGSADGVKKGDAVLSGEGLIGHIVEVGENSSRVLLVTDINSRVPVLVEDTLQHAIMKGMNNDFPELIHYPQGSNISQGARIITSGHGDMYPPGLPIGRVVVDPDDNKRLKVGLFSMIDRLLFVRIIKKNSDDKEQKNILLPEVESDENSSQ